MGRGDGEVPFSGCSVSVWEDKVLEMDGGNGGTPMIIHLMPINCTLKVVTMTKFMAYMSYQNKKQTLWFV